MNNKCFFSSGTHRPIWPIYGEYKFVPRQRWLHSLEVKKTVKHNFVIYQFYFKYFAKPIFASFQHGAVVMLYHPCANHLEVEILRKLVTGCIRRHIISPSNFVSVDRVRNFIHFLLFLNFYLISSLHIFLNFEFSRLFC